MREPNKIFILIIVFFLVPLDLMANPCSISFKYENSLENKYFFYKFEVYETKIYNISLNGSEFENEYILNDKGIVSEIEQLISDEKFLQYQGFDFPIINSDITEQIIMTIDDMEKIFLYTDIYKTIMADDQIACIVANINREILCLLDKKNEMIFIDYPELL